MNGGARSPRRPPRSARALATVVLALLLVAPSAAQAAASPAQKLIRAYSPIQMLRSQENGICDEGEEQYQPMSVDVVLGNPGVQLKLYEDGRMRTVKTAPTAGDIAGLDSNYYLNLPGDPLSPECTYAEAFDRLRSAGKAPPITYAHIARETGHSGFVVQYWFFYYFNQFNDLHEGDWEGMQIAFDADTATQALKQGPSRIAVFQHGGGEAVDWGDSEVEKEGTHPVVYPAAGSHATFFESAIFVENGQGGAGLGCDNTSDPVRRLVPRPVRIPTYPAVGSPAQWLTYEGHWGQREKGYNTGPTGPNTKTQWTEPFTWMDGLRSASPKLPAGSLLGPAATSAFCGTVAAMSNLVNLEARSRFGLFVLLAILAVLIAIPVLITTWRPADPLPMRQRRAFGQLLRAARKLYGRQWRVFILIALTSLLALAAVQGVAWLFGHLVGETEVGGVVGSAGSKAPIKDLITSLGQPLGFAIGAGAVIANLCLLDRGAESGVIASYRLMFSRFWRLVFGQLAVTVLTAVLGAHGDRHPDRDPQVRRLDLRPAGDHLQRPLDPRGDAGELQRGPRQVVVDGAGGRRLLGDRGRSRPDPHLRPDLRQLLADRRQPDRLDRLRDPRPLRRGGAHPPVLRSREAARGPGAGAEARLAAALDATGAEPPAGLDPPTALTPGGGRPSRSPAPPASPRRSRC